VSAIWNRLACKEQASRDSRFEIRVSSRALNYDEAITLASPLKSRGWPGYRFIDNSAKRKMRSLRDGAARLKGRRARGSRDSADQWRER